MRRLYLFVVASTALLVLTVAARVRPAGSAGSGEGVPDTTATAPVLIFPPGTGAPVRIRASEDTLPESRVFEMPEVNVQEVRVPLLEIIRKAQAGEGKKYADLTTMAHTETMKLTLKFGGRKPEARCLELSTRVYYRAPETIVRVPLREKRYKLDSAGVESPWDDYDEDEQTIQVESGRRLTELPFYLQRLDKFTFKILERRTNEQQVLYKIGFEPRSDFDNLPGGTLWLLTGGYQIIHEEFHLKNLPVPWVLKSLGLLTREWQQVEGRWVTKRITARAEFGLNFLGIPESAEVVLVSDDYRFNLPIDPRIFEGGRQ